jgi:hypothetical protein
MLPYAAGKDRTVRKYGRPKTFDRSKPRTNIHADLTGLSLTTL